MKIMSNIANLVVEELKKRKLKITMAESCTGGMLASTLVSVAGVSNCFDESYVVYSNEAKIRILGVKKHSIEKFGVVSKEIVREMSLGLLNITQADVGVAISGLAGPDGGSATKPVGTVCISISKRCQTKNIVYCEKFIFSGNRDEIREESVEKTLDLLLKVLKNYDLKEDECQKMLD